LLPLPKSELIIAQGSAKWVVYSANSGARVTELTPIPGEFTGDGVAGAIWTNPKYVKGVATSVSIRWLGRGGGSISNLEWRPSSNEVFSGAAIAPDGSLHCFGVRSARKPQLATYKILPGKSGGSPTLKEYTRTSEARRAALQSANVLATSDSEDKLVKATLDAVSSQIVERVIPEELAPMPKSSRMLFRFNHDQLDWFDPSTGGRMFTPILLRPKWGDRIGRFDPSTKLWLAHDQGPSAYERLVGEKLAAREDGLESGNRPVEGRARTILLAHERTRLVSYVVDIEGSIGKSVGVCYPVRESPIRGEVVAFADNGSRVVVDISPKPKPGQKAPERVFQVLNTTSWKIDGPIFKESNIVGANGKFGMRIDVALSPDGQSIAFRSSEGGVLYAVDGTAAGTLIDGEAAKSSTGAFGFDRTGRYLLLSKPQGAPNGDETIIREVGGPLFVRLPAYRVIGDKTGESFAVLAGSGVAIYRPGKGFEPNSLQRVPFGESIVNAEFADSDRYLYLLTASGMMQVWKTAPFGMAVNFVALTASNYVTFDNSYQYMASRGGAQAISFQKGRQQVSFDSYDLTLNRPDIILDALGAASKSVVSVYSKARKTRLAKYWEEVRGGGGQRDPSKDIAVPLVKLLLPNGV
ncbi:MAG TPA: hypothetical protein VK171_03450, partial [Fimbriimonas sp.]|nr:hypothetical protein [Fimbriimonas sp.]